MKVRNGNRARAARAVLGTLLLALALSSCSLLAFVEGHGCKWVTGYNKAAVVSLGVDSFGCSYALLDCVGSQDFGNFVTLEADTSAGYGSYVLVSYGPDGGARWAVKLVPTSHVLGVGVTSLMDVNPIVRGAVAGTDANGTTTVVFANYFDTQGPLDFGQGFTVPSGSCARAIQVGKDGTITWLSTTTLPFIWSPVSVALDAGGNTLVFASCDGLLLSDETRVASIGLVIIDPSGTFTSFSELVRPESTPASLVGSIVLGPQGDIFAAGSYVVKPSESLVNTAFYARFGADGSLAWMRTASCAKNAGFFSASVDGAGGFYAAGVARGAIDFGGGVKTSAEGGILLKVGADGTPLWVRQDADHPGSSFTAVACNAAGGVYAAEVWVDDWDPIYLDVSHEYSNLLAYDSNGGSRWTVSQGGTESQATFLACTSSDILVAAGSIEDSDSIGFGIGHTAWGMWYLGRF
jgi:hypothetical protein